MADEMEIIISAIDSASPVFQDIISNVNDMSGEIIDSVANSSAEWEDLMTAADSASDAFSSIDTSTLEDLSTEIGMGSDELEGFVSGISNVEGLGGAFAEIISGAQEASDSIGDAVEAMGELGSAGDVMAASTLFEAMNGVADGMWAATESAGNFSDSIMRASLEAEGAGISAEEMTNIVSGLSDATGRAGGQIRESFIKATARGVTDMDSFKTMMMGAGAQATLFGTDIQSMGDKFSGLAMKSNLMEKKLAETGITMDELGEAMGLTGATADEVKDKWKELDANQRAAALGMAASMNEGKDANQEYKNSWAGLQEQVDIAKGKLERMVGSVLLPVVVPAMKFASDTLSGLGSMIDSVMKGPLGGLISILGTGAGVFLIAATGILALKNLLGFLKLEATFTAIRIAALQFAIELEGGASIVSAAANVIGASGFGTLAAAAWGAATAVWAAMAPLLPYIAVAAAVAIAIYEVGKAFNWWHDVSSMLDAIKAGLTRLWNAFINHPDVQATIQAIVEAWNWLSSTVVSVGQAVLDFFGINEAGNFDIVHEIILGLGRAWEALSFPIRLVITVVQALVNGFYSLQGTVGSVWATITSTLSPYISQIVSFVQGLIGIFNRFRSGQMSLPAMIIAVLTRLWNAYNNIMSRIGKLVIRFASQLLQYGIRSARNFMNGLINRLRALPGRVYSVLSGVVNRITSAIRGWINAAKEKAHGIVDGVGSVLSGTATAVSNALGGVKDALIKPFQDAWNSISGLVNSIKNAMPGGNSAGYEIGAAGFDLGSGQSFDINTGQYIVNSGNQTVDVNHSIKLTLDLQNVPAHIDTKELSKALTNKKVLRTIADNSDFQSYDSIAKKRLRNKTSRATGR